MINNAPNEHIVNHLLFHCCEIINNFIVGYNNEIINLGVGRYRRYRAALSRDSYRAIRKLSPLIYSQSWVQISTKEGKLG